MAILHSYVSHYKGVKHHSIPLNHHFPMVFLWFSYNYRRVSHFTRTLPRWVRHPPGLLQLRAEGDGAAAVVHRAAVADLLPRHRRGLLGTGHGQGWSAHWKFMGFSRMGFFMLIVMMILWWFYDDVMMILWLCLWLCLWWFKINQQKTCMFLGKLLSTDMLMRNSTINDCKLWGVHCHVWLPEGRSDDTYHIISPCLPRVLGINIVTYMMWIFCTYMYTYIF